MHRINQRRLLVLSAGVLAVGLLTNVATATHSWGGYHWARTTPQFTLKLGKNLSSADWINHLSATSSDWNSGNSAVLTAVVNGPSSQIVSAPLMINRPIKSVDDVSSWQLMVMIFLSN